MEISCTRAIRFNNVGQFYFGLDCVFIRVKFFFYGISQFLSSVTAL